MEETTAKGQVRVSIKRIGMLAVAVTALAVACGSPASRPALGPVATLTPTASSIAPNALPDRSAGAPGPYPTIEAAAAYVKDQQDSSGLPLRLINPQATWRPSAVLHVIHATPGTGATWGGDNYFFFVNGSLVGRQSFTGSTDSIGIDDSTYSVTYWVFMPNDPHCCPSGGQASVRFRWDGNKLNQLDPMPGPTMQ